MTDEALPPSRLVTRCDPDSLGFALTSDIAVRPVVVGQDRAVEAIQFAIDVAHPGYNLFVVGPTGSGRARIVRSYVEQRASGQPVPSDYCYVHNFDDPRRPRALRLPPGQGTRLKDHLERLVEELQVAVPAVFESQSYRERRQAIAHDIDSRHEREMSAIVEDAQTRGVGVLRTPSGIVLTPIKDGEPLDPDAQEKLAPEQRERLGKEAERVQERLQEALQRIPVLQREQRERVKVLDQEVTRNVVEGLLTDVRRAFSEQREVLELVDAIERDVVEKASHLLRAQSGSDGTALLGLDGTLPRESPVLRRYRANLVVDHHLTVGAPVIELGHPTSGALVGKVEHVSQLGTMVTDFNLVKGGALQQASGGYLIIDARRLLSQPVAYEQLKRTLRERAVRIESVPEALDLTMAVSLEPEPIPFTGKVILIGESWLYQRLSALDPELAELFKVTADLETDVPRTPETTRAYAALMARVVAQDGLLPMRAAAVARVLDLAAREAEDSTRLSMHVRSLFDVLREAHYVATAQKREVIEAQDVERAIVARERRQGRLRERVRDAIAEGTLHVETTGAVVGQVNGLTVARVAGDSFGFPTRISARVRLGGGELVDIEREIEMGGPMHSKGVLILRAVLGSRYLADQPHALHASLVLEQSYGMVDGDSASLAELLALLSAIGELPLQQSFAVTGSIDQHGRVQAVGGMNEKIEGFFEVCTRSGDPGPFAVIIPRTNVRHLMLRAEVVAAAERGELRVYPVQDVDEALALITGLPAGARGADGAYAAGSANRKIEERLAAFGKAAVMASRRARGTDEKG